MSLIKLIKFFLAAAVVTALCGLVYVAVQQNYRQTANDPQIQMAEDAAAALVAGGSASPTIPLGAVDISRSLAPYVVVYDDAGRPVAGSGLLNGRLPTMPSGVLEFARQRREDRITWQPQPGVRSAVVIVRYDGENSGFVLAGRSLREVERREDALFLMVGVAWAISLAAFLALFVIAGRKS